MKSILRYYLVFLTIALSIPSLASADWINFSGAQSAANIAEIYVEDDHIRLVLEIYIGDLEKFIDLIPDNLLNQTEVKPPPLKERLKRFSTNGFQFLHDGKKRLQAELKIAEPRLRTERLNPFAGKLNPYTRQRIPGPPEDKRVLYVELVYPFESKPEEIIIIPPLGKGGFPEVPIGFIAYHKGVPIVDYRYLSESARLNLDWDDPWYSHFNKKALKRWQQSGLRIFLYIEPYEVRHEILVRVKDLAQWMDLDLRGEKFIEIDEFESLKKRAGEFFLKQADVLIDNKKLRPILDRTSFVKYTMTRTFFIDQPEQLQLNSAMFGVILTYITPGIPREVKVDWSLFSDKIQKVPTNAIDPAGPFPSYVTPDDNMFVWKNYLKKYRIPTVAKVELSKEISTFRLPLLSLLCIVFVLPVIWQIRLRRKRKTSAGLQYGLVVVLIAAAIGSSSFFTVPLNKPARFTAQLSDNESMIVLNSLLKNVYRSFDFREESDIYDRLAISVSGNLLEDIYLQNRKSMVIEQAGGAQAKVKKVEILKATPTDTPGKGGSRTYRTEWTAMGTVGHWGHIHTRLNRYEALISLTPVNGSWKITGLELLEEKRIDPLGKK
jgi:hypothetical protein